MGLQHWRQGQPTRAEEAFVVVAPDGIAVHPVALPGLANLTLAEGRLPPGEYGVHAHRSLEQITYVLAGQLVVTMGDPVTGDTVELACALGDAVSTPPLVTLSFRNPGPAVTRVLFICAPPYPADDADTLTFDRHRALTPAERQAALERQRVARVESDARFEQLRAECSVGRAE
jgi:mannose-6-phosphate isomerase-like protein (cupin superfamily)